MAGRKSLGSRIAASFRGRSSQGPEEPIQYNYGDIVLLGMSGVGKTAIADRFVNNYFTEKYAATDGKRTYEVKALIECEDENSEKKGMVMKKSFKKSVMGASKPPLRSKESTRVKSVLSVRRTGENNGGDESRAYQEGKAKGLKDLQFNLVDTPPDLAEMEPITFQATVSNAKGFLLVCSFDKTDSLEAVEQMYEEIRRIRCGIDADTPVVLIANKRELDEELKVVSELDVSEVAARLHIKWCVSDMSSAEGCVEMSALMLSEINMAATQERYLESLAEDEYMYVEEQVGEGY